MFQPPVPVASVLEKIHSRQYLLPAIQREFIWGTDQIRALFDSLLRGYPIGAFLFWQVDEELASDFTFYDFITHFHEKDHPYAPVAQVPEGKGIVAILDGQQRLTALNIGVYGSHAERLPRKWWDNPEAFPKKHLYLNLLEGDNDEGDELNLTYDFKLLTPAEAKPKGGELDKWFRVGEALGFDDSGPAIMDEVTRRDLGEGSQRAFNTAYQLFKALRETPAINSYIESSQDPNKVLDIFVRVNSGGTPLSYSDLLLSMATNQWKHLNAREEVRDFVSSINDRPSALDLTKDIVLKAGLVLIDVPDIGFKVSNFTQANMLKMESEWSLIKEALSVAVGLLESYGYTGRTLNAKSVVIPLAYYAKSAGLDGTYIETSATATDRDRIRRWVHRSMMKRGVWGSGLDTLLRSLRDTLRDRLGGGFPDAAIADAMASLGKPLSFEDAEIDELLDLKYGSARAFSVLATLYPGLDPSRSFHVDHIFPRSLFTRTKLARAGVPQDRIEDYLARVDRLANLQLLAGLPNIEKQDALPHEWFRGPHFPSDATRDAYVSDNDLQGLPESLVGFVDFYEMRRNALKQRVIRTLGLEAHEGDRGGD